MALIKKLAECIFQPTVTGATPIKAESLWENQSCIITFFRRFGCKFCRLEAANLSKFKPALDKRGVRLVGVSFDTDGLAEFQQGQFFNGELFLDPELKAYQALNYPKVSMFSGFFSLFSSAGRNTNSDANQAGIAGNMKGDGWQTGGLLVVGKGGEVLYEFKQEKVVNHPDYKAIMRALDIDPSEVTGIVDSTNSCNSDQCQR